MSPGPGAPCSIKFGSQRRVTGWGSGDLTLPYGFSFSSTQLSQMVQLISIGCTPWLHPICGAVPGSSLAQGTLLCSGSILTPRLRAQRGSWADIGSLCVVDSGSVYICVHKVHPTIHTCTIHTCTFMHTHLLPLASEYYLPTLSESIY